MEDLKYKLINKSIEFDGKTLYRIETLTFSGDIEDIELNDLDGDIEYNINHEGEHQVTIRRKSIETLLLADPWRNPITI